MVDVRHRRAAAAGLRELGHRGHRPSGVVGLPGGAVPPLERRRRARAAARAAPRAMQVSTVLAARVPPPRAAQREGQRDHRRQRDRQRPHHRIVAAERRVQVPDQLEIVEAADHPDAGDQRRAGIRAPAQGGRDQPDQQRRTPSCRTSAGAASAERRLVKICATADRAPTPAPAGRPPAGRSAGLRQPPRPGSSWRHSTALAPGILRIPPRPRQRLSAGGMNPPCPAS